MRYATPFRPRTLLQIGAVVATALAATVPDAAAAVCNITINDMNFADVDTLSGLPSETSADVAITCEQISPQATTVTVCGNFGEGSGGATSGARHMLLGAAEVDYQLYSDSGSSVSWGAYDAQGLGSPTTIQLAPSGGSASAFVTIYGRVFGGQISAPPGTYLSTFSGGDVAFIYAEGETLNCTAPAGGTLAQASFTAQATVSPNCLVEAEDIDFGQHGIIDAAVTAVGDIRVSCTPDTDYTISLGGGLTDAADPEQRVMRSANSSIAYGLYSDPGHSRPWGAAAATLVRGTGIGTLHSTPVYGRVLPQASAPGVYADTVVVTITYQ